MKKKVYFVHTIFNSTELMFNGWFKTKRKAAEYIEKHHLYQGNAPMYIVKADRYKKDDK